MPNPRVVTFAGKLYQFASTASDAEIAAHLKKVQAAEADFPVLTGAVKAGDDVEGADPLATLKGTSAPTISSKLELTPRQLDMAYDNNSQIVVNMPIRKFLTLTTMDEEHVADIVREAKSVEQYNKWAVDSGSPMPMLEVDAVTGKAGGHEGRHRAAALLNSGETTMPVAIQLRMPASSAKLSPEEKIRYDQIFEKYKYEAKYQMKSEDIPPTILGQFDSIPVKSVDWQTTLDGKDAIRKYSKALAVGAGATAAGAVEAQPKKKVTLEELRPVSLQVQRRTGVPSAVLLAKAETESSLRPDAVSHAGAKGLFQMLPRIGKHWGDDTEGKDWAKQANAAGAMLMDLKKEFKTWPRTWAAYNWGETNLRKHLKKGGRLTDKTVPKETRLHVARMILATRKHGYDPITEKPIVTQGGDSNAALPE